MFFPPSDVVLFFHWIMLDITVYSRILVAKFPQSGTSVDLSDISKVFRPADILGVPQAIKGFDKSDFWEVLNNLNPADLNPICKILKFHIASANPNFFACH